MLITRTSPLSGKTNTMDLPVTQSQMDRFYNPHRTEKIQHIFPNLSADQREFILTGITAEEWDQIFKED